MSTLTLSGWTQPADALAHVTNDALSFDYSDYTSPEASFVGLKQFADVESVIGWSMGGQLALRAIAAGMLKPKHVTLIATPWQFVADYGMGGRTFELFYDTYARDAASHKARFHALIAKGDKYERQVLEQLRHHPEVENTQRWLPWLEDLGRYSLDTADLSKLPPTLLVQGRNDTIVRYPQALKMQSMLPQLTLSIWEEAGHAPHLHDPRRLLKEIVAHRAQHKVAA